MEQAFNKRLKLQQTEPAHLGDWEHWVARSRMMLANDKALLKRICGLTSEAGISEIHIRGPIRQGQYINRSRVSNPNTNFRAAEELTECADHLAAKYGVTSIRRTDAAVELRFTYQPGFAYGIGDMLVHMEGGKPGVTDYDFAVEIEDGWYYAYSIT